MERFSQSIENAYRAIQTADHLTYITLPIVKEKRLLLKILSEINTALISMINAVLQFEHNNRRLILSNDAKENFAKFRAISESYGISQEQFKRIVEIISLNEKHKKSPFEFVKNDQIVIMSDGMSSATVSLEKIKSFILESKELLKKINAKMGR